MLSGIDGLVSLCMCVCLLYMNRYPNATPMFQQVLQQVHAMRLMFAPIDKIEWVLNGVYNRAIPSPGESIALQYRVNPGKQQRKNRAHNWVVVGRYRLLISLRASLFPFTQHIHVHTSTYGPLKAMSPQEMPWPLYIFSNSSSLSPL